MNHDEWLAARRLGVSGTDISVLMGANPYKTEEELVMDKLGIGKKFTGNAATRAGLLLETHVASLYSKTNQVIVTPGEFTVSPQNPRFIGTPDFLCGNGSGLEIKTGSERTFKDGYPKYYEFQCRWYALITERPEWNLFGVIVPKDRSLIPQDELLEYVSNLPVRQYQFHREPDLEAVMSERAVLFLEKIDNLKKKVVDRKVSDWLLP